MGPSPPRRFGAQADANGQISLRSMCSEERSSIKEEVDRYLVLQKDTAASMLPALRGQGMAKSGLI